MSDATFALIGKFAVTLLGLCAVVTVFGLSLVLIAIYLPRLHVGKPPNPASLTFTGKQATFGHAEPQSVVIQSLSIKWWLGISHRPSTKWFLGFIRWDKQKESA